MTRLSDAEVEERLRGVQGWTRRGEAIARTYAFPNFTGSMAFVNRVAAVAEAHDHHPDILIEYSRVTLTLSTHDAGGLTERDFRLAAAIDSRA